MEVMESVLDKHPDEISLTCKTNELRCQICVFSVCVCVRMIRDVLHLLSVG